MVTYFTISLLNKITMIEESRIIKNLKKFSFPRLSGTKFELKAFHKVKKEVENLNLQYKVQEFTFSSFYSRTYPKVGFTSGTLIYLLIYLNYHPIFTPILLSVLGTILITSILLTRRPEKIRYLRKFNSQNLLVKLKSLPEKIKNNDRVALFISHLDSKGQRFKIQVRIKTIKLWIATTFILIGILSFKIILFTGFEDLFYLLAGIPLILNILSAVVILLNSTNNSSEGAVDNASGIACNLELLTHFSKPENRLTNYEVWHLFTGAEECGTMGIRHFFNNLENYDPKESIAFNFESIAKNVYLFPGGKEGSNALDIDRLLIRNNRKLKIRHYITNRVLGTHSDGGFLGDKGFQGYGIGEVEAYEYMHTSNDTLDKINTSILKKLCLVLVDSVKKHDSSFFK